MPVCFRVGPQPVALLDVLEGFKVTGQAATGGGGGGISNCGCVLDGPLRLHLRALLYRGHEVYSVLPLWCAASPQAQGNRANGLGIKTSKFVSQNKPSVF